MRIEGILTQSTIVERFPALLQEASQLTAPGEIDVSALAEFDSAGFACLTALKRLAGNGAKIVGASDRLIGLAATYGAAELLG
jgi:ABC-type transporter Mla MlaB component